MLSNHAEKLEERLSAYKERLYKLVSYIEKMGATPVMVTQIMGDSRITNGKREGIISEYGYGLALFNDATVNPAEQAVSNGVDHYIVLSLFNQISMEVCQDINGICIDLANEIQFENGDFYDRAHNTKRGSEKIGDYLFEQLKNYVK